MYDPKPFENEADRLKTLHGLHLLDAPIEERFERITRAVKEALDVPIVLFNLIDEKRQYFKSAQGLEGLEASLEGSFCTHALHEKDMLLIPNASLDPKFLNYDCVTAPSDNVGFYAGCPVRAENGLPVGVLCAVDTKPRKMSDEQLSALREFAGLIETELLAAGFSEAKLALLEELSNAQLHNLIDPDTHLWNKEGLISLLEREWKAAARDQRPITVIAAGIDRFEDINSTF